MPAPAKPALPPPAGGVVGSHWLWEEAVAAFEAQDRAHPPVPGTIAFVGSSTFTRWDTLVADMAPLPVYNRAFGGTQVHDQVRALPRILLPHRPAVVVYYCGDNDITPLAADPQAVLAGFSAFHARLRQDLPTTRLVHVGIKPSILRLPVWPAAQDANARVRAFAAHDPLITCIDPASVLFDARGAIRPGLHDQDDLHLNPNGYVLMTTLIRPAVEHAWMKARS